MKVILLKDVARVGQQGSVIATSDGYALNYLIPNGLAAQATPDRLAAHEAKRKSAARERQQQSDALAQTVQSLEQACIEMKAKATEKGGLFKSVTAADIASAIQSGKGALVPADAIKLPRPIKTIGKHDVLIEAAGTKATVCVEILAVA